MKKEAEEKKAKPETRVIQSSQDGSKLKAITLRIPIAYLEILDTECELLYVKKRSMFLSMLLRWKRKELQLVRPETAPDYHFSDEKLTEMVAWTWYVQPADFPLIEADRVRMGLSTPSMWVTQLVNYWIGKPFGFQE